jgi:tripartite-type tricarboxylate transporter receptor subunit TctC
MRMLVAICAYAVTLSCAHADQYPSRLVTIITPFAAGSGADIVARQVANGLTAELGQRFIVDNRSGAGGNIGTQVVARSNADGYTLVLGTTGPLTVNPTLYKQVGFDPFKDFAPISLVASGPLVLVANSNSSIKSLSDLVARAREKPGKVNCGNAGVGSTPHLAAALLNNAAHITMVHVPYRGNAEMLTDVLAGNIDVAFSGIPAALSLAQSGAIRMLMVTSTDRLTSMPDVPSITEAGYANAESSVWYGLLAPSGTPTPVIEQLNAALAKVLGKPETKNNFEKLGLVPTPTSAREFGDLIRSDYERWGNIVKAIDMTVE